MTGPQVRVERGEDKDPGTGRWYWRIRSLEEPTDYNNWAVLVDGCVDRADALSCAAEHGWTVVKPGSRSAVPAPRHRHLQVVR